MTGRKVALYVGVCELVSCLPVLRGVSVQERGGWVLAKSPFRWWFTLLKWHLISFAHCAPSVGGESAGLKKMDARVSKRLGAPAA